MELNNIYDLLLKFLLLKNITLSQLLVLSFPEGSVGTIDGTFGVFFSKQILLKAPVNVQPCWLSSSRGHWDLGASAGQPWGCWTARDPLGARCSHPAMETSPQHPTPNTSTSLWRELALNLGIIFIHLLPLGVLCPVTPQLLRRRTEPSSALGVGTGAAPGTCPRLCLSRVQTFSPISS